jgi:pimeloyl-ACP methyl ester carboxylesterase
MGTLALKRLLSVAVTVVIGAIGPPVAQISPQLPLVASCQPRSDQTDAFTYRFCTAYVPSFDGVPLDVDLTLPAGSAPSGGFPLLVMMHGWGGSKSGFESATFCSVSAAEFCNYNNLWFASRGYAVITYTARGFHGSCGPDSPNALSLACARGWTHLADMRYEVRDTQYLAGLLVDAGVARPDIGVTGLSYGGGQSWLLAVLADQVMETNGALSKWRSPNGGPMRIAAAVPRYTWTDLIHSLQPNGRESNGVTAPNGDRLNPLGIQKKSYNDYLYASGLQTARYAPPGADPTADLTTWYTQISAGETPAQSTYAPAIVHQIAGYKSAYYQDSLLAADKGANETPVFAIQGWTDALFPEAEAASMVQKLRAVDPNWPVFLYASDLGHPPANNGKSSEWSVINQAANNFLDLHLKKSGGSDPASIYQLQVVKCESTAGQVFSGNDLASITPARVTFDSSELGHLTTSASTDPVAGAATDPIAFYVGNGGKGGCIKLNPAPPDTGASTSWTFSVTADFTLLGEPALRLNVTVAGIDAEINSRLWDIAPDGTATLVTRGAFRWTSGSAISYALQGNGWVFHTGHKLQIQVTQNDAPYLRLDNYPSVINYSSMQLTLPTTA